MLTVSSLFRRTLDHCNRAGTQLSVLMMIAVVFSSVFAGLATHMFAVRALRDAPAYWKDGMMAELPERAAAVIAGDPDEFIMLITALQETLEGALMRESGMTQVKAAEEASKQVGIFLFTQSIMLLPVFIVFAFVFFAYLLLMRSTAAWVFSDSRNSLGQAFKKGLKKCIPLFLLGCCISLAIGMVSIPILLFAVFLHSLFTLAFAFAAAIIFGFITYVRLIPAQPFLVQDGCGIFESMRKSWHLTEGKVVRLAGVVLAACALSVAAAMTIQIVLAIIIGILRERTIYAGYLQYVMSFASVAIAFLYNAMTFRCKELLVAETHK